VNTVLERARLKNYYIRILCCRFAGLTSKDGVTVFLFLTKQGFADTLNSPKKTIDLSVDCDRLIKNASVF
jgi:hypothetical protein